MANSVRSFRVFKGIVWFAVKTLLTAFTVFQICGCNQIRLLSKMDDGSTHTALQIILGANTKYINELKLCLAKNDSSIKELGTKPLEVSYLFVIDLRNSEIKNSVAVRRSDDLVSAKAIDQCNSAAAKIASDHLKSEVIKYNEKPVGFRRHKSQWYADGTVRPRLDLIISDEPKTNEDRAIFARAKD